MTSQNHAIPPAKAAFHPDCTVFLFCTCVRVWEVGTAHGIGTLDLISLANELCLLDKVLKCEGHFVVVCFPILHVVRCGESSTLVVDMDEKICTPF